MSPFGSRTTLPALVAATARAMASRAARIGVIGRNRTRVVAAEIGGAALAAGVTDANEIKAALNRAEGANGVLPCPGQLSRQRRLVTLLRAAPGLPPPQNPSRGSPAHFAPACPERRPPRHAAGHLRFLTSRLDEATSRRLSWPRKPCRHPGCGPRRCSQAIAFQPTPSASLLHPQASGIQAPAQLPPSGTAAWSELRPAQSDPPVAGGHLPSPC